MDDLTGKVALVTGSSRGIGRAIAVALAEAGASVAINYRSRAAEAEAVEASIRAIGHPSLCVQADVSGAAGVEHLLRATEASLGPVEILVNNAGIARPQPVEEITLNDWDEIIAVNLTSCFLMTQAALPAMRAPLGAHHQPLFRRRSTRRCHRPALRRVQGRHPRPHSLLRPPLRSGGHHRQHHRSGPR
jgi:3-oxoacyl-[acyl-carrier protein] reductase